MQRTTKDRAIDSIIGADGFMVITARNQPDGFVAVNVFQHGEEGISMSIASEMLYVARKMIFGNDGSEVERLETPESGGEEDS